jgi:cellulose synthase/poly-beta-1,6-N-acetylglucosamine synthase-like glycosyltransferase
MSNRPLISVVIPTYNRTNQTFAAVESVLAQTYTDVEVLVVDDGSKDDSGQVVERFVALKAAEGHRVRFFSQPNQGASVARNTGIAKAQGEYIAFLDSDDVWLPEKLQMQMDALQQLGADCGVCFTDARLVNDAGLDVSSFEAHGKHYRQLMGIDPEARAALARSFAGFWVSSLLVRSDIVRKVGGFTTDISFVEDRDLHFRLSLVTSVAYVNKPLIQTDRNPSPQGSTCRPWDKLDVQFRQQQRMLEKWLRMGAELPPDVRGAVKQALGALHSQQANWHLENSRYSEAREAIASAFRYKKTVGVSAKFALTWLAPTLAKRVAPKTRPIGTGGHAS